MPLSGQDAAHVRRARPSTGNVAGDACGPPWADAQAFRFSGIANTMNDVENNLFSGPCPWQLGHEMRTWQYGHGTQVPLPPQTADNS